MLCVISFLQNIRSLSLSEIVLPKKKEFAFLIVATHKDCFSSKHNCFALLILFCRNIVIVNTDTFFNSRINLFHSCQWNKWLLIRKLLNVFFCSHHWQQVIYFNWTHSLIVIIIYESMHSFRKRLNDERNIMKQFTSNPSVLKCVYIWEKYLLNQQSSEDYMQSINEWTICFWIITTTIVYTFLFVFGEDLNLIYYSDIVSCWPRLNLLQLLPVLMHSV